MSANNQTKYLVETAIFAALAMGLSLIPDFASWFTPSFGAIVLVIFALRRGVKYGVLAGLIWGLLHFLFGRVYYLSMSQVLIEYILAFMSMGIAGLFTPSLRTALSQGYKQKAWMIGSLAALAAVGLRYLWHFIAGVIFWGSYAPKGTSAWMYSLSVNGTAACLTFIFVVVVTLVLITYQATIFLPKD
ncbi:energy-coupled thiamine transporter ThiT [Streptococcus halichoeri]|uniref:energy-coupled thiamine transporter ThiT n=1 Tax=Streptococcus halichoeri TaxID=254785 RepID=UPI00135A9D1E|nr:energy-coupled thiamine transporter ThiT [Streptococcus halichoeri]